MYDRQTAKRKVALGLSALAIIGMGSITVACSPRTEKPAETSVPSPSGTPTEKGLRTNVTRAPISAAPNSSAAASTASRCRRPPKRPKNSPRKRPARAPRMSYAMPKR